MASESCTAQCIALLRAMPGHPMEPAAAMMYEVGVYRTLSDEQAMSITWNAVRSCRFRPSVAALLEMADKADGRPEPDEAWAMCPMDEAASVVWTEEMRRAFGTARPLILAGDIIAARKAFLDVYKREVQKARLDRRPPEWTPSLGTDAAGREECIREAAKRGRIHDRVVQSLISGLEDDETINRRIAPEVRKMLAAMTVKPMEEDVGSDV